MSVLVPYRRSHRALLALILVDLPVIIAALVAGAWFGFVDTYVAVSEFRLDHPWTLAPTFAIVALLVVRWWRA